ncbi:MAG TPA: ATP-NAD kinase [Candidatus Bathyarchaeota archaeon]|nr:ATP-NAD kinase [Candidatus Bathyarchaeota archaeon]
MNLKLGFVVNPIAGMGGRVGLKGTDGVLKEALARGAKPVAPQRAKEFLHELKRHAEELNLQLLACPGIMGEKEAREASFKPEVLPLTIGKETTAEDTKKAVRLFAEVKVDLIVFVGGDGTARDIYDALKNLSNTVPVLGVPSGVKMYSGIFAVNPRDAAEVVAAFAKKTASMADFEIMDADEEAIRSDRFAVKLYGFLRGPFLPLRVQASKQVTPQTLDERENQKASARFVVEEMVPDATYILGPGTTVKCVAELLGVEKTLLGVDLYRNGKLIKDVDEKRILREVNDWQKVWIIVSPIGRQGMLFGRGNQQISPEIIKRVGKKRIIVVATRNKVQSLDGGVLRVDTGDAEVDEMLKGYIRVVTDYKEWRLVRVV